MGSKLWSSIEIQLLTELYGKVPREELEYKLTGRTYSSIKLKASRLKLSNSDNNNRLINDPTYYPNRLLGTNIKNIEPYRGSKKKIAHQCQVCEYIWSTSPDSIYTGSGCPNCNRKGGKCRNSRGYLYLLHIKTDKEEFLKVGITILDNKKRLNQLKTDIRAHRDIVDISILKNVSLSGEDADSLELLILKSFPRYITPYEFSGYTELIDIVHKDSILEIINEIC